MKNLATCKPSEFIGQTARIKDAVANWVDAIDLIKIRSTQPNLKEIPLDATEEQAAEIKKVNADILHKHAMSNINKLLDKMLVEHPKETLDIIALTCFVEPEHVDDYPISDYLSCIMDMLQDKTVMNFFSLLAQLQTQVKSI